LNTRKAKVRVNRIGEGPSKDPHNGEGTTGDPPPVRLTLTLRVDPRWGWPHRGPTQNTHIQQCLLIRVDFHRRKSGVKGALQLLK